MNVVYLYNWKYLVIKKWSSDTFTYAKWKAASHKGHILYVIPFICKSRTGKSTGTERLGLGAGGRWKWQLKGAGFFWGWWRCSMTDCGDSTTLEIYWNPWTAPFKKWVNCMVYGLFLENVITNNPRVKLGKAEQRVLFYAGNHPVSWELSRRRAAVIGWLVPPMPVGFLSSAWHLFPSKMGKISWSTVHSSGWFKVAGKLHADQEA